MTKPLKLYRFAYSGHAHRAQLFLSLLGLPFESIDVDLTKGAQQQPSYLAKNPLGQVPVLEDGELTICDSNAILVYLALRYDESGRWYPREPEAAAKVQRWFSLSASDLVTGPGALRVAALFRREVERAKPEATSERLFGLLEATLQKTLYLVGDEPTVADVALYTYTAHAPEGGVSLEPYPAVRAWLARIEALPHFVPMKRIGA